MNRADIRKMLNEASMGRSPADGWGVEMDWEQLERFAALVAAAEREECAKVVEGRKDTGEAASVERDIQLWNLAVKSCARAIRARGANE